MLLDQILGRDLESVKRETYLFLRTCGIVFIRILKVVYNVLLPDNLLNLLLCFRVERVFVEQRNLILSFPLPQCLLSMLLLQQFAELLGIIQYWGVVRLYSYQICGFGRIIG